MKIECSSERRNNIMNQIELIKEAGRKAFIARKNNDESTARFHFEWARKAIYLEDKPSEAQKAFEDAYREEAKSYGY